MSRVTSDVNLAAAALKAGKVVAYPTEGVWGLGCDPDNPDALKALLALKRRDPAKGLIMIAAAVEQFRPWFEGLPSADVARMEASWPAPLTWLVPDNGRALALARGEHDRVAVRVTEHALAASLCTAFGGPIISTSANRASEPSALTLDDVQAAFGDEIELILDGHTGGRSSPSDIRDLESGEWLRGGSSHDD